MLKEFEAAPDRRLGHGARHPAQRPGKAGPGFVKLLRAAALIAVAAGAVGSLGLMFRAGQRTPPEAMESWMQSTGHRANILNGQFTEVGLGVAANERGMRYWTQVFALPQ